MKIFYFIFRLIGIVIFFIGAMIMSIGYILVESPEFLKEKFNQIKNWRL